MALVRPSLRFRASSANGRRSFHTTRNQHASILFALSGLSNSRETQHFNKLSRLNRIEHSPPLKLIKSSEIDPFPLPAPLQSKVKDLTKVARDLRSTARIWDERALRVGRVALADHAQHLRKLSNALQRAKEREVRLNALLKAEKLMWAEEARRLRNELRTAGLLILLSVGTATALATWRFWPQRDVVDTTSIGKRIEERTRAAMSLPAVAQSTHQPVAAASVLPTPPSGASSATSESVASSHPSERPLGTEINGGWWRSLFWKQ